ncbi:hypothetical protein [Flavobacterium sp. PL02]|uniref:hypothetical protein n=1 Tax=Flavobacterium sp. PL02 TaxID=3088354 RepID=UPI002B229CE1|nr:hypothetical protein [Flavobacterium sp. PL02]MEA9411427.1 hypothetical protein [Flavobacterium sp. PL02]
MRNKIGILILSLFCQLCIAQTGTRMSLHGRVVNDSVALESGYVLNVNTKTRTFISSNGLFDILAKPKDTLLFSSLAFQTRKMVLTEKEFAERLLVVRLGLKNNQLKEVVIPKGLKVKSLDKNSQKYVDMQFEDDKQSTPENSVSYSDQTIKYGTDFVRIFKDVKKLLNKSGEKEVPVDDVAFTQYVRANFSPSFFAKTLELQDDEIDLFLMYSSNDPVSKQYLKPEDRFQLMDFLINKSKEFKKVNDIKK